MKLLAVDTSAKAASICFAQDGQILADYFVNLNLTHSQTIMPMCEHLLQQSGITPAEIDYFAVSNGPGSFTGLRIGISAVKGLAYAAQKPCVAVSTLDALAQNLSDVNGVVCAVMDARCNQVYHTRYLHNGKERKKLVPDTAIPIDVLYEQLKQERHPIFLVGDGADLCYNQWKEKELDIRLCSSAVRHQRASSVALLAFDLVQAGQTMKASELMPEYLRLPQAQRELIKRQTSSK